MDTMSYYSLGGNDNFNLWSFDIRGLTSNLLISILIQGFLFPAVTMTTTEKYSKTFLD